MLVLIYLIVAVLALGSESSQEEQCPSIKRGLCCTAQLKTGCKLPRECGKYIIRNCPKKQLVRLEKRSKSNIRRAPQNLLGKCGTAELNYQPCTSKGVANKLFLSCCQLYVPEECHHLCSYETNQDITRNMIVNMSKKSGCGIKNLSSILYCASQNRDNRKCCIDLDLNSPQLQVGSRCLRFCDPSGTEIERIAREDVTCLYNWNVIMYCHHSGIREM